MNMYKPPTLLADGHGVEEFECISDEQTLWLRNHARQASRSNLVKVSVITPLDSDEVVAYYAWRMAQMKMEKLPPRWHKGAGGYDQPLALLARLATSVHHEGHGLGKALLQDALQQTINVSQEIGCRGLLVHAESHDARNFYKHTVPSFQVSPIDELNLVLLMKDIRKSLHL